MTRFNAPPGWPVPPNGQFPPPTFVPDPRWPPAPQGWAFYLDDFNRPAAPPPGSWAGGQVFGGPQAHVQPAPGPQAFGQPYGQQPPMPGQMPYAQGAAPTAPPRKKKTGLIIGLVAGGLVLVLVAALLIVRGLLAEPVIASDKVEKIFDPPMMGLKNDDIGQLVPGKLFRANSVKPQPCWDPVMPLLQKAQSGAYVKATSTSGEAGFVLVFKTTQDAKDAQDAIEKALPCFGASKLLSGSSPRWATYRGSMFDLKSSNNEYFGIQYGNTVLATATRDAGVSVPYQRVDDYKERIKALK